MTKEIHLKKDLNLVLTSRPFQISILNAYYLPGIGSEYNAGLYPSITPVNTFRLIFNNYFGTNYNLLDDKSYFSTSIYPYKFIDVTNKIRD